MNNPRPYEVNTDQPFWNMFGNAPGGAKQEASVRVFCIAAQKYSRWNLTQEELNESDSSGFFTFNGLMEEGWFEKSTISMTYQPTRKMYDALTSNGLIWEPEDEDEDEGEIDTPKLKLYTARVIYTNQDKKNSYFTILDVNRQAARMAVLARVNKLKYLVGQRGPVMMVELTDIEGPFEAGQILHEER